MTYANLLCEVQDRVNRQRQMERLISRTDFVEAFERAAETARITVYGLVAACNREGVLRWVREQLTKEYGECSLRELRRIGQRLGIPRYNNLPKELLLSEIVNAEARKAEGGPKGGPSEEHHATALANA